MKMVMIIMTMVMMMIVIMVMIMTKMMMMIVIMVMNITMMATIMRFDLVKGGVGCERLPGRLKCLKRNIDSREI